MKKLLTLIAAGAMLFGSVAMASATDIKIKGKFDFGFGLYDGTFFTKHDNEESFDSMQRFRTQVDFIASESLKGVLALEIGNIRWGHGGGATWQRGVTGAGRGAGGAMGADGVNVEVQHAYLDWVVPNTELQVRMGIQPYWLPNGMNRADWNSGNFILDDDLAGILLSYGFNENIGVNLAWFRPWDPYNNFQTSHRWKTHDEIDTFILTVPIEVADTFTLHPYGMFASVGMVDDLYDSNDLSASNHTIGSWMSGNAELGDDGTAWWAGLAASLEYFDPFYVEFDFAYGRYSADNTVAGRFGSTDPDRAGWVTDIKFGYRMDSLTPILFGWYGSGADVDGGDGMDGMLPVMSSYWGMTSFGWAQSHFGGREYLVMDSPAGTWGIGAGIEDIRFLENLTSQLRFAYFRGTSDVERYNENAKHIGELDAFRDFQLLDKSDWGMEINLDNKINIYENLDMYVELAYIHMDVEHHSDSFDGNAWKSYVGFTYNF